MLTYKILGVAGFVILYLLSLLKIRKLKFENRELAIQKESEKQKRFLAEKEKRDILDAVSRQNIAHTKYKERVESVIKEQATLLNKHGLSLILHEDKPWNSE
ncbi:MAG: hypothetical protein KDH96_00205 [Candidatus Riesia sp.]|nr:hypothetical protein [Candidatus Riesia sp.]